MCGRYTLYLDDAFSDQFGVEDYLHISDSYNVTPGRDMPVIVSDDGNKLSLMRWGLIPSWAKDPAIGQRMFNARIETVSEKPSFRSAFKKRRCVVPANGFYEWKKTEEGKQPIYIQPVEEQYFGFAGLYENWQGQDGAAIESFTIITREASPEFKDIHQRMPVILPSANYSAWLSKDVNETAEIDTILHSAINHTRTYLVSSDVNNPRNDGPELILELKR
jgi:putative SOS response-associated peptidase YedK